MIDVPSLLNSVSSFLNNHKRKKGIEEEKKRKEERWREMEKDRWLGELLFLIAWRHSWTTPCVYCSRQILLIDEKLILDQSTFLNGEKKKERKKDNLYYSLRHRPTGRANKPPGLWFRTCLRFRPSRVRRTSKLFGTEYCLQLLDVSPDMVRFNKKFHNL